MVEVRHVVSGTTSTLVCNLPGIRHLRRERHHLVPAMSRQPPRCSTAPKQTFANKSGVAKNTPLFFRHVKRFWFPLAVVPYETSREVENHR